MSRPQRDVVVAVVNEHVQVEDQELHPGDSVTCDIPDAFEPGDLLMGIVTTDGLQALGRVKSFNLLRGPARRQAAIDMQGERGSKQRT